jgi:hypothetical protein
MDLDLAVLEVMNCIAAKRGMPDPDAVKQVLAQYQPSDWPTIAAHARAIWTREVSSGGDLGRAIVASMAAHVVYRLAGQEEQSLRAAFDCLQAWFMLANDLQAYTSTRQKLIELHDRAASLAIRDVAFEAMTTAADCSYFAAKGAADSEKPAILESLVTDLLAACEAARLCEKCRIDRPASFEKFVSLLVASYETIQEALTHFSISEAWLSTAEKTSAHTERMRRLATAAEAVIPADLRFVLHREPEKSGHVARMLADLSSTFGDRQKAKERLRRAIEDE